MKRYLLLTFLLAAAMPPVVFRPGSASAEPATINWGDLEDEDEQAKPVPSPYGTPSVSDNLKSSFFHNAVKDLPEEPVKHLRPSPWQQNSGSSPAVPNSGSKQPAAAPSTH